MQSILLFIHVLISLVLIALVLIQHGKGADVGAAFGSGASQTVFGSQGSGSFLVKVTGLLAACFFITSLTLGYLQAQQAKQMKNIPLPTNITIKQPTVDPLKQSDMTKDLQLPDKIFSQSAPVKDKKATDSGTTK